MIVTLVLSTVSRLLCLKNKFDSIFRMELARLVVSLLFILFELRVAGCFCFYLFLDFYALQKLL